MQIAHDMEQACPEAWFVNFTNPMVRICDAVKRYTQIKVVGLCHQIGAGFHIAGRVLGVAVADARGHGLPASLLAGWLGSRHPELDLLSHTSGHLWEMLLGWSGARQLTPLHLLSDLLIAAGFVLVSLALFERLKTLLAAAHKLKLHIDVAYASTNEQVEALANGALDFGLLPLVACHRPR